MAARMAAEMNYRSVMDRLAKLRKKAEPIETLRSDLAEVVLLLDSEDVRSEPLKEHKEKLAAGHETLDEILRNLKN